MGTKEFILALARGARGKDAAKALILPQIFGGTGYVNAGTELTVTGTPPLSLPKSTGKPLKAWNVDLLPYQDLHGYDNPWPAGGGVNIFDEEMELGILNNDGTVSDSTSRLINKNFMPITAETEYCYSWNVPADSSTARPRAAFYDSSYQFVSYVGDLGVTPTNVNGRLVSTFTTPASSAYMKFCMYSSYGTTYKNDITFNVSNASYNGKYYPYSNICPITGTNELTMWTSGSNLLDLTQAVGYAEGTATFNDDGSVTVSGSSSNTSFRVVLTGTLPAGTYTATNFSSDLSAYLQIGSTSDYSRQMAKDGGHVTFTYDGTSYLRFMYSNQSANTTATYKAQIEVGSSSTDYVKCTASSTPITFPALGANLCPYTTHPNNPRYFWGSNYSALVDFLNTLDVGTYTISNKFEVVTLPQSGSVTYGNIWIRASINGTAVSLNDYVEETDSSPTVGKVYNVTSTFTITEAAKGNITNTYFYCDSSSAHSGDATVRGSYNAYDISVQANTLYGGTYDPVTGVGTITWASVDMGDLDWYKYDGAGYGMLFYSDSLTNLISHIDDNVIYTMAEMFGSYTNAGHTGTAGSADELPNNGMRVRRTDGRLYVRMDSISTAVAFDAAVTGKRLCYTLATPIPFTTDGHSIKLPKGNAYTWATAEDGTVDSMSVTYIGKASS